jgi:hypothetical protein
VVEWEELNRTEVKKGTIQFNNIEIFCLIIKACQGRSLFSIERLMRKTRLDPDGEADGPADLYIQEDIRIFRGVEQNDGY